MKVAPATALTFAVELNDMSDDEDINIEVLEDPQTVSGVKGYTLIDMVVHQHRDILYMKTSGESFDLTASLLGNEKSLLMFEQMIEKKSKQIFNSITLPL